MAGGASKAQQKPRAVILTVPPRQIATLPVGFHSDGSNLHLRVTGPDRRAWVFRYMSNGKVRQIGLGSTVERAIGEARDLVDKSRRALLNGEDPASIFSRRDPESMKSGSMPRSSSRPVARAFATASTPHSGLPRLSAMHTISLATSALGPSPLQISKQFCDRSGPQKRRRRRN